MLLVAVSAAAGFTYLIWDPTGPDDSTVVLGIRRLNELATVEQTVQAIVTEEENDTIGPVPVPEWLRGGEAPARRGGGGRGRGRLGPT